MNMTHKRQQTVYLSIIVSLLLLFAVLFTGTIRYCRQLHSALGASVCDGIWTIGVTIHGRAGLYPADASAQEQQTWAQEVYPGVLHAYRTLSSVRSGAGMRYLRETDPTLTAEQYDAVYALLQQAEAEVKAACLDSTWQDDALAARAEQALSDLSAVFAAVDGDDTSSYSYPYCLSAVYDGMEAFFTKEGRHALYTKLPE